MNPYKVLGVSKYSSKDELKSAYQNLVKKFHPDTSPEGDAKELAAVLNAWAMVKNKPEIQAVYRISVSMTQENLAENLGKTLDISVDDMLLSIKVPYRCRMGDTIILNIEPVKILVTIKEENER